MGCELNIDVACDATALEDQNLKNRDDRNGFGLEFISMNEIIKVIHMNRMETSENEIAIKIEGLTKDFGKFRALSSISFDIKKGEIMGFLGPNGAGKTTTMRIIGNLIKPTEGRVLVNLNGNLEDIRSINSDLALDRLGFLIEVPEFYRDLSPRVLLSYFAKLRGYPRSKIADRVEAMVSLVGMKDWIDEPIKNFSKGMIQKIGIVQAIVHDPDIIVLDEPTSGLDPSARKEIRDLLIRLKKEGKTIFLSSHQLFEVSEICDRIAIINHGRLLAVDTLQNLEKKMAASQVLVKIKQKIELEKVPQSVERLEPIARKYASTIPEKKIQKGLVFYDIELPGFRINFDGLIEHQESLLKDLVQENIGIIEYTIPKTDLLERLYMKLVQESDKTQKQDITIGGL